MRLRKKKSLIDQAGDYAQAVKPHVEAAIESARDFVADTAVPALADARDKAGPALADARSKAGPMLADARDKAAPVIADARAKAAPVIADARSKAAPLIASGTALAAEKATAARDLADAKVAQLKGEEPPQKGGKLKKFVLFAGIAGAVAFVAKKLQGGNSSTDNWQSSYVPTPAPTPAPTPTPPPAAAPVAAAVDPTDDTGGSSPDEAIADAAEAPHPITTPDNPADVVEIDDPKA